MSWRRGRRTGPRAVDASDPVLVETAEALVSIVADHVGRPRAELERALDDYIGSGTDYRTLRGLIKLLDDRCVFETSSPVDPLELRREVFRRAAAAHPVDADDRERVLRDAAAALGLVGRSAEPFLFADLTGNQRLEGFEPIDGRELLERYNLAQAQALLYRCVRMTIRVDPQPAAGVRRLFDAIKAYRLIYSLSGDAATGYDVALDGPVSIFHRSQKYGVQMAVFLPALLECERWRMSAEIETKGRGAAVYEIDSRSTRLRPPEDAGPPARHPAVAKILDGLLAGSGAWTARPCNEIVDARGTALAPDVVAAHEDGTEVYVEVLGFWTPRSLATRVAGLERAPTIRYLFLASEELLASRESNAEMPADVVIFKSSLDLKAVRAALERLRDVSSRMMT
jgi:predicted nuclease of restriction endonuclease-like RecB superfamily